jgi:hypothetical protein
VKGDSCLVLRMTVWIKGILEFLGEVMDGVKWDSCLVLRMTRWGRNGEEAKECKNSKLVCLNLNKFYYFIVKNNNIIME